MSLISTYRVTVDWGDCDPAEIVFYPNYFSWFDAAAWNLMRKADWTLTRMREKLGIVGVPLAEASVRFQRPSRYGQSFEINSRIESWEEKRFTVLHQAYRDDALLLEGRETRFCGRRHPQDPLRLQAIAIPSEFKEAFGA